MNRRLKRWVGLLLVPIIMLCVLVWRVVSPSISSLQAQVESIGGSYDRRHLDLSSGNPPWISVSRMMVSTALRLDRESVNINFRKSQLNDDWLQQNGKSLGEIRLHLLDISETDVTDTGVAALAAAKSVGSIDFAQTAVTDHSIPVIVGLKNMHAVDLRGTQISSLGLIQLTAHPRIWRWKIDGNLLTDEVVSQLNQSPQVRELTLENVTADQLEQAKALKTVQALSLSAITDQSVPRLVKLKNLKYLTLYNDELSEEAFTALQKALPGVDFRRYRQPSRAEMLVSQQAIAREAWAQRLAVGLCVFLMLVISCIVWLAFRNLSKWSRAYGHS